MKKLILTLFGLLLIVSLFGQSVIDEEKHLKNINKKLQKSNDIQLIKDLESKGIVTSCQGRAFLQSKYADYYKVKLRKVNINKDSVLYQQLKDSVLTNYQKAIDMCASCSNTLRVTRLEFIGKMKDKSIYRQEEKELKKLGYKPMREGMALGGSVQFGKKTWIGLNFSLLKGYQPSFKMDGYKEQNKQIDFIGLEVLKSINQNAWDINFSLLKVAMPVHVDITKFGYQKFSDEKSSSWYYRPEIGYSWRIFSFGYSYSLYFNKVSTQPERHLFFLRASYPLVKYDVR